MTPVVSVLRALMFRERRYKTVTVVRSASMIVSVAVGGAYLLIERDGWGLVIQIVLGQSLLAAGLWWASAWRLALRFDRTQFRELFGYSGLIFANDVAVAITKNFDVVLIGRVLSEAQVGLYSLAFYITDIARMNLMAVLNRVMFTQYSSIQQDHALVRRYYAITLRWNCLVLFPMMLALILFGPSLATQFLGAEWEHLTFPLQALAVAVIIHAAGGTTSTLFRSLGKPGLDLTLYLLTSAAFLVPLLFVGVYWWGIDGAAAAVALNRLIAVVLRQYWLNRLLPNVTLTVIRVVTVAALWQLPLLALGLGAQLVWPATGWVRDALLAAILLGAYFTLLAHRARTERA
jgi:O-antigen/teichoic acid export membrane protein